MTQETNDINVLNAIQHGGDPLKSYRKAVLGKVFIHIWNSFTESPEGILLSGKPTDDSAIFDVWTPKELAYFEAKNKRLITTGNIIKYARKKDTVRKEKSVEEYTDVELTAVLKKKYFSLRSFLDKVESEPVLFRLLNLAEEIEKPAKTVDAIRSKLAEVQANNIVRSPKITEEE